MVNWWKID